MSTILIADDEPFIVRSLAFMLRKEGYDVITADNGASALELLRACHSDPENTQIDLVFLDIMMPKLTGFEVLEALHNDEHELPAPIIFLSAKGMEEDRSRGLELGATDFLSKPFSPSVISQLVRRCCDSNSSDSSSNNTSGDAP